MTDPLLLSAFSLGAAYTLFGIIHRLYFSPIAGFPGPKLAAVTWWYEYYYDVVLRGKYIWKIKELHKEYGPIVRINPYELHVIDPGFWDTLYNANSSNKRNRWDWHVKGLGLDDSTLGTVDHDLHRNRRAALSPFFSKQNVRRLQPLIDERADKLVDRLANVAKENNMVPFELAFSAFTNDVVVQYSFGQSDHRLEAAGFSPEFHHTSFTAGTSGTLMRHNHWMLRLATALPERWAMHMGRELASFIVSVKNFRKQVEDVKRQPCKRNENNLTIFHELLESDLPNGEKTTARLAEEAILMMGAGTHTTSWALTVLTFHLLSQPNLLQKLKTELENAMPDPNQHIPLATLETLPYLTAVIKEGLRLSYGNTSRMPRIAPNGPMVFNDWVIPPGTPVSMMIPLTHHNEDIFPDSHAFKPDRWIEDNSGQLNKYLCSFSKGSRACLGVNLAWAELYICVARLFRDFGSPQARGVADVGVLELYHTDVGDVELVRDLLFPVVKDESKGVRVKVSKPDPVVRNSVGH